MCDGEKGKIPSKSLPQKHRSDRENLKGGSHIIFYKQQMARNPYDR